MGENPRSRWSLPLDNIYLMKSEKQITADIAGESEEGKTT
jgi:hypothetical protein